MSKSNCAACVYKAVSHPGAHCYMFKREPDGRCRQFVQNKLPINRAQLSETAAKI